MKFAFYLICIIWFSSPVVVNASEENEALIFDRFDGSLFLLPKKIPKNLECGAWAIACPAETPAENDFVRENSFTRNALFVKEICTRGSKISELKKTSCKEPYKISLSYKVKNSTFQFGYEIYYELGKEQYFHRDNTLGDYRRPGEVTAVLKNRFKKGIFEFKEMYRTIKKTLGVGVRELWFNKDRRMGFTWLYLFMINFDFSKKILKMIWYEIEGNNRWTTGEQCENNSLGIEPYEKINVDGLYVKQSQIFETMKLLPGQCESNDKCLTKWLLIPIDQFRLGYKTPPVCSNMATIPIWKNKVEKIMKKVDTFLYSLFRTLNEPLQIISGITGELQLQKNKGFGKTILYLDPENRKIPVPKIIYKIVEYKLKGCKEDEMDCWYSAIIVIHNDFSYNPKDRLCKDVTTEWGWEEITENFDGDFSDMIYVCENNTAMQRKLYIGSRQRIAGGLSLIKFPFFNTETMQMDVEGRLIKYDVEKKYKDFRKKGEINLENDQMTQRSHTESNVIDPEVKGDLSESDDDVRTQNRKN